jgi:hypothetical protein
VFGKTIELFYWVFPLELLVLLTGPTAGGKVGFGGRDDGHEREPEYVDK